MLVFFSLAVLVGIAIALVFNQLVAKRQLVRNGWSDIDVQLKRRATLIPRLVEVVKGYAAHERDLFEEVAQKRSAAQAAGDDPKARGAAEKALARPVSKVIAVAEDYPELKASEQFLNLQQELSETEDKIELARRFYNGAVRELNTKVETIPSNIVAGVTGFEKHDYFEISVEDRAAPEISVEG